MCRVERKTRPTHIHVCVYIHADQEGSDVELDREFLQGLRELKFLSEKECVDEHKSYVRDGLFCVRITLTDTVADKLLKHP